MRETSQPLKQMFDAVPRRYDLLNRLLTFRMDQIWRRRAARRCVEDSPSRVLDLCCGTGDLALELARQSGGQTEIVGLDYSAAMLEVAESKVSGRPLRLVEGDAAEMAFADGTFDAVGIAFAFRNLTWRNPLRDRALAEVLRVLRPGGRFVIVETSQPRSRVLRSGFHAYLQGVTAPLGGLISGQRGAYHYLAASACGFYDLETVSSLLIDAGFAKVHAEPLMGGVAAIHVASKAGAWYQPTGNRMISR